MSVKSKITIKEVISGTLTENEKKEVEQMFEENGDLVLFRPYRSYNISSYEKRELGIYGVYVTTPWPEKNKMVEVLINEL